MKSYAKMTVKEKATLMHELFPAEVGQIVRHCRTRAEEVYNNKLIIRKWLPHSTATSWHDLAGLYLDLLRDNEYKVENNALGFARYLFRKRLIYFTKDSIENYLEYGYCKDEHFAFALQLFLL